MAPELTEAQIERRQQIIESITAALNDPETESFIFFHTKSNGKKYASAHGFFSAEILNVLKKYVNSLLLECHLNNLP